MKWYEIAEELSPRIKEGDTNTAITRVSDILRALPEGPFHQILDLKFTNEPQEVAAHFDTVIRTEKVKGTVGAVYTETNGFDINPDRWYFDTFAYREYGGHDDYDWLSGWDSDDYQGTTLTGLESLQEVYESEAFEDETQQEASEFCSLLVVFRFQDLIRKSVPLMHELDMPLLATTHGYDYIAEFRK